MAETKLKLDIEQGILEVEGSESFVRSIYDDFKEQLSKVKTTKPPKSAMPKSEEQDPPRTPSSSKRTKGSNKRRTPKFLPELDLTGGKDLESLKDFYSKYNVSSNLEKNLVFSYYLEQKKGLSNITIDHIFTCYRTLVEKVPKAFGAKPNRYITL